MFFNKQCFRSLMVIALALAAWLFTCCGWIEPSHACCGGQMGSVAQPVAASPACCRQLPVVDVARPALAHVISPDSLDFTGPSSFLDGCSWLPAGLGGRLQGRVACVYVPDQSNRYLLLRVLLN